MISFDIYQGTSDEVRLEQRQRNQAVSAVLAKGGNQYGLDEEQTTAILRQAGYTGEQLERAISLYQEGQKDGLTFDENGFDFDIGNYGESGDSWFSFFKEVVDKSTEEGKQLLTSLAQTTDYLDPKNQSAKNYDQVGVSGRKINRAKREENILLANRRFNNANIKSKQNITLYMPQKITFNDQLVYSEEEMGPLKSLTDAITGKRGGVASLVERGSVKAITDVIIGGAGGLSRAIIGADAVSPVVNLAGDLNFQAARNANTRSVANPRREMMFKESAIRNHSFTFEFAPKNPAEAETALNIVRMLRYHAYPGLRTGGHFLTFPAEFQVTFYTMNDSGNLFENDHLPKLPRLALQSVGVDFSPTESFKTFPDSRPAFIRLELGFVEMEQLTNEHIIHGY
jgi:hypothetical protein